MGLLSSLGGLIGLAVGGPVGAALGSGIGTLASGGDLGDALKSGILGYGLGSIPGVSNMAAQGASALGMQGAANALSQQAIAQQAVMNKVLPGVFGGAGGAAGAGTAAGGMAGAGAGGLGSLLGGNMNNFILASLIEAAQPRGPIMSELQQRQMETGERLPDYKGTPAPDYRYGSNYYPTATARPTRNMAQGGYIEGPGTGKSDSIPAAIYQNGGRVQEARLSDGEFVMTADAVRGMGGGNRGAGAAKMYQLMRQLERRA